MTDNSSNTGALANEPVQRQVAMRIWIGVLSAGVVLLFIWYLIRYRPYDHADRGAGERERLVRESFNPSCGECLLA
jgi:hypothetical protein